MNIWRSTCEFTTPESWREDRHTSEKYGSFLVSSFQNMAYPSIPPTSFLRLVAWMAHRPPTASLSSLRDALLEAMGDPQSPALRWGLRCGMDLEIATTWIGGTKVVGKLAPWSSKKQLAQCTFIIIFVYDAVGGKENLYKHRFTSWNQTSAFYSVVVSKSGTSWVGTFIGSSGL